VAYDPAVASAMGVRTGVFEYAILVMVAIAVVVALKAIGIVLVNAMLIIPAATAGLFVRRLPLIMIYGAALAFIAAVVGLQISFYARVAASPAVVLTAAAMFLVAALVTSRRRAQLPPTEAGAR
jgi:ABC-type Mn2+/Zn2+ transport system permease subunit